MAKNKIEFEPSKTGEVAYVYLPDHPGRGKPGVTKKQVRLRDIYPGYKGADLYFDFDHDDTLIGIDIMV